MAKGKFSQALVRAGNKVKSTALELESVKKLRAMDRRELKQLGITAGVAAVGGGIAGYTIEQKIQEAPEDKISADSFLKKGAMGLPATTILGAVGAVVAAKKLSGTKAVAVTAALGGLAGGGYAYKKSHEA